MKQLINEAPGWFLDVLMSRHVAYVRKHLCNTHTLYRSCFQFYCHACTHAMYVSLGKLILCIHVQKHPCTTHMHSTMGVVSKEDFSSLSLGVIETGMSAAIATTITRDPLNVCAFDYSRVIRLGEPRATKPQPSACTCMLKWVHSCV